MADKQSSQGRTLQRAQEQGRDPSSSTVWGQPGFQPPREAQSFVWDGDMSAAPDWIDRGWAGYDQGPALQIPQGNPEQAPYTTKTARVGDTITYTPGPGGTFGGFAIVTAQESGRQPGPQVDQLNAETGTPTFRPAAQTEADLNDLVKTGLVHPDDMDPEARAQWAGRRNQGKALTAEQSGHIPSNEGPEGGPMTPDSPDARQTPNRRGQRDPLVGEAPQGVNRDPRSRDEEEERERQERQQREQRQQANREREQKEQDEQDMREENERKERERREREGQGGQRPGQGQPQPSQQPAPPRPPTRGR